MTIQIYSDNSIILDNEPVRLSDGSQLFVVQRKETIVYSAIGWLTYQEHKMPHSRYSFFVEGIAYSGIPGLSIFEKDIRNLVKKLNTA